MSLWRWGFEMLLEMPGHHAEVWALALSTYGEYIVTGADVRLGSRCVMLGVDWCHAGRCI
jgi:hypothetical protein